MEARLKTLINLFDLKSREKGLLYCEFTKGIKTDDLINFANFAFRNKKEFETQDALISRTAREYLADITIKQMQNGFFRFANLDDMIKFIRENLKGKEILNGRKDNGFLPFVILSINEKGNLFSKYTMREVTDTETQFYKWLFENQNQICRIERVTEQEFYNQIQNEALLKIENQNQKPMICDDKRKTFHKMIGELVKAKRINN